MTNAIHVENLNVKYGHTSALCNVCLDIEDKDFLGIIGPNGGGKSTLLKSILNLIPATSGKIEIFGKENKKNRHMIGYVPQFSNVDKSFPISVLDVAMTAYLKNGLHPFFRYTKKQKDFSCEQLKRLNIDNLKDRQISELSGGEFQRLLIARALVTSPKILLLDEPTASIDPASRECIYSILEELNKNITILLVTHDLMAISSKVKNIACLNNTLVYHGEPKLTENIVNHMYGCPIDLIAHGLPHRVFSAPKEVKKNA